MTTSFSDWKRIDIINAKLERSDDVVEGTNEHTHIFEL